MDAKAQDKELNVGRFYDHNTGRFLRFGQTGSSKAIHQPLYLEPGYTLDEAIRAHYGLIIEEVSRAGILPDHICDLGCGAGDALIHLALHWKDEDMRFSGITLSERQAEMAGREIARKGLSDRVLVVAGSYQELRQYISNIPCSIAIESLIHSPDIRRTFSQLNATMPQGSTLLVFDDFLRRQPQHHSEIRVINEFRDGWQAHSLYTIDELHEMSKPYGFRIGSNRDLSSFLRLNRPRDRFIRAITPLARAMRNRSQYARFLTGGNARQEAYRLGLLGYNFVVFEK